MVLLSYVVLTSCVMCTITGEEFYELNKLLIDLSIRCAKAYWSIHLLAYIAFHLQVYKNKTDIEQWI